jgi:peptidoglycan hydrolase-like protein with peptidoglycan-binding domain
MHFEVGDALIRQWHTDGRLGGTPVGGGSVLSPPSMLTVGDRGPEVVALQNRLNELDRQVKADGIFGTATRAALMVVQASRGLRADGVAGPDTLTALDLV